MIKNVTAQEVGGLIAEGAQLVEVMPAAEYEEVHLPGAISLPLKQLNRETAGRLAPAHPIVVYCYDYQ